MSEKKDRRTCIDECLRALKDAFRQDRTLSYSIKLSSRKGVVYFQEDNVRVLVSKRGTLLPKLYESIESNLNDNENIEIVEVSYKYNGNSPIINRDWTITNDTDDAEEVRRQFEESKRENEQLSKRNEELAKENEEMKSSNNNMRNSLFTKEEEDAQTKRNREQIGIINDTFAVLGNVFGVNGLGDLNTPEGQRIQFALGMLQKQMNAKEQEEKIQAKLDGLQSKLDDCESTLKSERLKHESELEREKSSRDETIRELRRENDRLKSESEKNLKKIDNLYRKMRRTEELQKDKDRRLREKMKPILEEYDKLKSKVGYSSEMIGGMLGNILAGFARNSKYGGLLGLVDDPEQEQQGAQEQPEKSQTVQSFYETMEEPVVAETYDEDEEVSVATAEPTEEREEEQNINLL